MSRDRALAALAGHANALACGVTWSPAGFTPSVTARQLNADFAFVPALAPQTAATIVELRSCDVAAFLVVPGFFGTLAQRTGWPAVLRRTVLDRLTLTDELRAVTQECAEAVAAGLQAGADAVVVAEDVASPGGWLADPAFVRDAVVPLAGTIAESARLHGLPAVFHSDGDVTALFDAVKDAGFSAVHLACGDAGGDLAAARAAEEIGLAALGGVRAADLGVTTPAEFVERAEALIDVGLKLLCDDGGLTASEQVAALGAVFDAVRASRS